MRRRSKRFQSESGATGSDSIGYGRPPQHTRFRPGQSGNPKGRPANAKRMVKDGDLHSMAGQLLWKILGKAIVLREGHRTMKVSKYEAIKRRFVAKAVTGEIRATTSLLQFIEKHGELAVEAEKTKTIRVRFLRPPAYWENASIEDIEDAADPAKPYDLPGRT
jgi:hypothetical protein